MRSFYPVSELFCWENIAQGEKKIVKRDTGVESLSLTRSAAPPRPEPFDRLKALSSIEGLGSKASHGIYAIESKG